MQAPSKSNGGTSYNPPTDLQKVVDSEIKEWHFHIYFMQSNAAEHAAALKLRDAVLCLRKDGAFVAVPLWAFNLAPSGPHTAGSYEIWCPCESFSAVYSYLCQNRGNLSILVHPVSKEERLDHDARKAWIGAPWPMNLSFLRARWDKVPLQYASLKLGYSSEANKPTLAERRKQGARIENILKGEIEAAKAPNSDLLARSYI